MENTALKTELESKSASGRAQDQLIAVISSWIAPLGYEVVSIEILTHRQKTLRLFIDFLESMPGRSIGIEDCAKVSRTLDEPLDQSAEVEAVFHGPYELEVSSPGVDRPLRQPKDFERFAGQEARIHVFRPLTAQELDNPSYQERNPKQKNFLGTLAGLRGDKVLLTIAPGSASKPGKKGKAHKAKPATNSVEEVKGDSVAIPLPLISKANLEPRFEMKESKSHESD